MLDTKKQQYYFSFIALFLCLLTAFIVWDLICFWNTQKIIQESKRIENKVKVGDVYSALVTKVKLGTLSSSEENETIETLEEDLREEVSKNETNEYLVNPWRIKIPKLELDAPIAEGTTQENLSKMVGHFEETSKWEGNIGLAGHNRGYECNFFQEIHQLEIGDVIIYTTEKGEKSYQVILNKVIKETDWSYLQETEDNRITLITCERDKREYRRCIQAIELDKKMEE